MGGAGPLSVAKRNGLAVAAAIFCGISAPLLASSPTVFGVALALGLLLLLAAPGRFQLVTDLAQGARTPLGMTIILTFVLWLPGVADSSDLGRSLAIWGRMVGMVIVAALIHYFLSRGSLDACLRAMVVAALACGVITLMGLYAASPIFGLFRGKGWVDVNAAPILKYYGSALAILAPVVVWASFYLGGRWLYAGFLHLAAAFVVIFAVDSLAGLLGLVAGLVVGGIVYICQRWHLVRGRAAALFLILLAVLLVVAIAWILFKLPPSLGAGQIIDGVYHGPVEPGLPVSLIDAHRQYIWRFAFDAALEAPYFGHGIDVSNYLPGASVLIQKIQPYIYSLSSAQLAVGDIFGNGCLWAGVLIGGVGTFTAPLAANRRRVARDIGCWRCPFRRVLVVFYAEFFHLGRLVAGRLFGFKRYRACRCTARRLSQSPAAMRA